MNLRSTLLNLLLSFHLFWSFSAFAEKGKVNLTGGFFSINAKAGGKSESISNPSAFRVAYQYPLMEQFEVLVGYSVLLADFSGSDLGYGLDVGANYYPFTLSHDLKVKDPYIELTSHSPYSPFVGLGFYQRQFQSVKNSYAGLGFTAGVEKYYSKKINFKAEARFINLGGSGDSSATESNLLLGIVYKL